MKEIIENNKDNISSMIYEIRGKQVIFNSDLARLYQCKNGTKEINQAVNRNKEKFPERFSWTLDDEETKIFWSQILTKKIETRGGRYKNPRVFTEQGIAMLSTILKTKVATEVSIRIMDTFVAMRKYIANNLYNNSILNNHENRLLKLENTFNKLSTNNKINTIFYNGQIYDAYSLLLDILNKSKEEIIIIDNYAGKELLDILKDINKKIIIISKNITDILINKYQKQYHNIDFKKIDIFHDRFIIIDRKLLYNFGASFKDLGKNCFAINEMNSKDTLDNLLNKILSERY